MKISTDDKCTFWRGADLLKVDLGMHFKHRQNLVSVTRKKQVSADAMILAGGGEISVYNTATHWDFKQVSNLQYPFGVKEPGCYEAIKLNPMTSILFIPRLPKEYEL